MQRDATEKIDKILRFNRELLSVRSESPILQGGMGADRVWATRESTPETLIKSLGRGRGLSASSPGCPEAPFHLAIRHLAVSLYPPVSAQCHTYVISL